MFDKLTAKDILDKPINEIGGCLSTLPVDKQIELSDLAKKALEDENIRSVIGLNAGIIFNGDRMFLKRLTQMAYAIYQYKQGNTVFKFPLETLYSSQNNL